MSNVTKLGERKPTTPTHTWCVTTQDEILECKGTVCCPPTDYNDTTSIFNNGLLIWSGLAISVELVSEDGVIVKEPRPKREKPVSKTKV